MDFKILQNKIITLIIVVLLFEISLSPSTVSIIEKKHPSIINKIPCISTNARGEILYVGGGGLGNYTSIQDAIDNATDGDTVFVFDDSSPYYENIVVNKSIQLIGEDNELTIIDGGGSIDVVHISANLVNINGFTIQNSGTSIWDAGIELRSNNSSIFDNIINSNYNNGINLFSSINNSVIGNRINSNDQYGIFIQASSSNAILNNIINSNNNSGIRFDFSNSNIVSSCNISNNGVSIGLSYSRNNTISYNSLTSNNNDGIHLDFSMDNNIFYNTIDSNNDDGVQLYRSNNNNVYMNNITKNNGDGILLQHTSCNNLLSLNNITNNSLNGIRFESSSNHNAVSQNKLLKNLKGIDILESDNNTIVGNLISDNIYGILLSFLERDNVFIDNIIEGNDYGIFIYYNSNNNFIYHNFFIDNNQNAYDEGGNIWDNGYPSGGNYWGDYNGIDRDGDGVGDTPYDIEFLNSDKYPLGFFETPHNPTITGPTSGKPGYPYDYTFDATDPNGDDVFYYIEWSDGNIEDWIGPYPSGEEITLNHTWNEKGTYIIRAKAKDISGAESEWGTLEVSLPVKQLLINQLFTRFIEKFVERFPLLQQIISLILFFGRSLKL
ncbi:MAG: right-handed parallel beta-helix repeat-containing protein [Thermoplasmatales archaeon]|nr:MAG: right-handed parallel beta-helix repeat-containing protein [Thermoplasmatales archaeon]